MSSFFIHSIQCSKIQNEETHSGIRVPTNNYDSVFITYKFDLKAWLKRSPPLMS